MLRRLVTVAALSAAFAVAGSAGATLLVYEPFAYAADTILDGTAANGLNLTGPYVPVGTLAAQKLVVSSPGLGYGSLVGSPPVAGQRANDVMGVASSGGTVAVDHDVLVPAGSALFFSALFRFDDSTNGNRLANVALVDDATGDEIAFGEPAVGVSAIRVSAVTGATGGARVSDGADRAFANGQILLLIGRYGNGAAAGADSLDLIGYDTADADVLPPVFDPSDPQAEFAFSIAGVDIDITRITSLTFTIRGDDNNAIDELRIGTSYASVVVPEPGMLSALLVGLAGLAAARSRRGSRHCAPGAGVGAR